MADRVTFTPRSAQRIADAVLKVEAGDRNNRGVMFGVPQSGQEKVVRMCTFTGPWGIGTQSTVTFKNHTTTPNTVVATNLFWPIPDCGEEERDCAIAKDGTTWYLLVPGLYAADAATAAIITESALEFKAVPVVALCNSSTVVFSVSVSTCATAT